MSLTNNFSIVDLGDNFRRVYGGIPMLNLAQLPTTPNYEIYEQAQRFIGLAPSLEAEIAEPPQPLQQVIHGVAADYRDYLQSLSQRDPATLTENAALSRGRILANPLWALVYKVDEFVDQMLTYREDEGADTWSLPAETAKTKSGDCEDYALLKYAALRQLGFPADKLWLSIGATTYKEAPTQHAVLMVEIDSAHYVLNNDRKGAVIPAADYFSEVITPNIVINSHEAYIPEDPVLREDAVGRPLSSWDRLQRSFNEATLSRLWSRWSEPTPQPAPQFVF